MRTMRRYGWVAGVVYFMSACGGGAKTAPPPEDPVTVIPPEPDPAPPPEPKGPSKEELAQKLVERYGECQRAANAQEFETLAGCYADDAEMEVADMPDKVTGGAQIAEGYKPMAAAFPDLAWRSQLILVNGDRMAVVVHTSGVNTGPFMGGKPTNRTMAMSGMRLLEWEGDKIKRETNVYDPVTSMVQLAKLKAPARKPSEPPAGEPTVVVATDSEAETQNVAVVKSICEAWNNHDAAALAGHFAEDVVWSDHTSPSDVEGQSAVTEEVNAALKAFPDINVTCEPWAAGNYVVNYSLWTATNKGAWKDIGIAKATNKPVSIHDAEIYELADGKVKKYWRFSNGLAFRTQLGLGGAPKKKK